jgi:hypothetical protein
VAYTIISQNNTTTTLSDENGNVITVPARVTLATSTDYTIKKVNNNSVDLEDGDGKIIRGVPACVVLAGEGGGGGGSSYTAGTGISIDANNEISVTDPVAQLVESGGSGSIYGLWASSSVTSPYGNIVLGYNASQMNDSVMGATAIGSNASVGNGATAIGRNARASYTDCIAIGASATTTKVGAIQIGYGTNATQNTLQVKSYTLLNLSDGTIPTARLTKVNTTATLAVADWSSSTQTVTVSGVAADSVVFVSPAPASASDYASAGILCTAQATDSLTFTCTTTPSNAITVNVICF